jgi:hypothetical protein
VTADQSATSPSDYAPGSGNATIKKKHRSTTIAVVVNGDLADEPNESFTLTLLNPTKAKLADATGVATITDNDPAPPPPPPPPPDVPLESEPNNTALTANQISLGSPSVGAAIGSPTDVNYFKVTLPVGGTLNVQPMARGSYTCANNSIDTDVTIYDTNAITVLATDPDTDYCNLVQATVPTGRVVYVKVAASSSGFSAPAFDYNLAVTEL